MHSAAAFLSMPNSDGVVQGGNSDRGFNDQTTRGYPLRLTLTTRQVTDVVMYDEEILSVKGGRMVKDDHRPPADEETRREETRKTCALRHLEGYPDTKVIDPIKDNYPACTMPLSATTPLHVTPEILCNQKYAQEYVERVALIRELLDQASLSTNHALLMRSSNQLLRSLGGLLKGASDCKLTREPIPVWNIVKIVRTNPDADRVRKTTAFLCSDGSVSINLPSAPMPMPEGEKARLMHPALVTHLDEGKPYYMKGGLIPPLTKKGHFWKSSPPAIQVAVLKYRLYIDPVQSAHLESVEQIDCGWTAPLPRMSHYDSATGLHQSLSALSAQYWVKQDGTTAKAASLAVPPLLGSSSVQRLTQHFEHMSLRNASSSLDYGSLLDDPTGETTQIQLNHDAVSWESYSAQVFPTLELV